MLSNSWRAIPEPIRAQLLAGSVGGPHLLKLAGGALTLATEPPDDTDQSLFRLGREMLLAAWEADFFNGTLAEQLLNFHARDPWLDPHLAQVLTALTAQWRQPEDLRQFERIVNRNEPDTVRGYVERKIAGEPENAFWLSQVLTVGLREGDPEWLAANLKGADTPGLAPLHHYALGMLAFFDGCYEESARLFGQAAPNPETRWLAVLEQQGHALCRAGDRDKGMELFRRMLTARPWHVNLALHAHDLLQGLDRPAESRLSGRTAVLLYSWDKADDLDRCLEGLSHSAGDWDFIAALDNGSEDQTREVLAAWQGQPGGGQTLHRAAAGERGGSGRAQLAHAPAPGGGDGVCGLSGRRRPCPVRLVAATLPGRGRISRSRGVGLPDSGRLRPPAGPERGPPFAAERGTGQIFG